jgi:hypothetical protein
MAIIPWPKEIQEHLIGECRLCLTIIADSPAYGRAPGRIDATLCECCDPRENGMVKS